MTQPPLFKDRPLFDSQTGNQPTAQAIERSVFLSRLILNLQSAAVRRDIGDCNQLHRTIMNFFPALPAGELIRQQHGVLHRLEANLGDNKIVLLVQSFIKPDWNKLPPAYLADVENNLACKAIADKLAMIEIGAQLMFRLRANPTKRIGKADAIAHAKFRELKNRRRVEILGESEQIEWLQRKSETAGFRLTDVRTNQTAVSAIAQPNGKIYGRRLVSAAADSAAARRETLTFGAVTFEGELTVTDADKFRETLRDGIGQGKAFGFGLLSVARPLSF